jgi:RNA polymerase sigma-70 factor (ECF subfamily)
MGPEPRVRLVRLVPDDDEDLSLDTLFRRHSRYVARIALRVLGRPDEVDDVVQDVFLAAERGLSSLANPRAVRGWLATIAVRKARDLLRRRRVRAFLGFDDAPDYANVAAPAASPADRDLLARTYAALDRLPVPLRLAWALRHIEGEPVEQVATLCGCSLATAKRRISAAHLKIQEALSG